MNKIIIVCALLACFAGGCGPVPMADRNMAPEQTVSVAAEEAENAEASEDPELDSGEDVLKEPAEIVPADFAETE